MRRHKTIYLLLSNTAWSEFSGNFQRIGVVSLILRRFIKIHLLSLLDGSPHEVPLQKVLRLNLEHDDADTTTSQAISRSRIALAVECTSYSAAVRRKELIVWDWRTGEVVSSFFSAAGGCFWLNLHPGIPTL